ncbi:MAG: hypothetical protein HEEMFOPI_01765 [Holosporales bacterium]
MFLYVLTAIRQNHLYNLIDRAQDLAVSEDPAVIRGLEQLEIERRGGAQSQGGTSSNAINSISVSNPKRDGYLDAAQQFEGQSS